QQIGMIADGHHRHDLTAVEEKRQRPLGYDERFDRLSLVIDAGDGHRQTGIVGIWPDLEFLHFTGPNLVGRSRSRPPYPISAQPWRLARRPPLCGFRLKHEALWGGSERIMIRRRQPLFVPGSWGRPRTWLAFRVRKRTTFRQGCLCL